MNLPLWSQVPGHWCSKQGSLYREFDLDSLWSFGLDAFGIPSGRIMINTLQAGRFLAAMAVVLHHAVLSVTAFVDVPPLLIQILFEYGYLGVDFFFVLSGFIIHYTMSLSPRPAGKFAFDRLARIMLPYWPVGIGLALAYMLLPSLSDSGRAWGWVSTSTLFPTNLPPALSVAWTLQHELVFYFIYAALYFLPPLFFSNTHTHTRGVEKRRVGSLDGRHRLGLFPGRTRMATATPHLCAH